MVDSLVSWQMLLQGEAARGMPTMLLSSPRTREGRSSRYLHPGTVRQNRLRRSTPAVIGTRTFCLTAVIFFILLPAPARPAVFTSGILTEKISQNAFPPPPML